MSAGIIHGEAAILSYSSLNTGSLGGQMNTPKTAAVGMSAAVLAASVAFGHARLLSTTPPADAQLQSAPKSLTLRFNENVRLAVLKIAAGDHIVPVSLEVAAPPARIVTVALPPLAAGTYAVQWSALTPSDGHVVKGTYSFVVR